MNLVLIPSNLMRNAYPASSLCKWYIYYDGITITWYNDYPGKIEYHSKDIMTVFEKWHIPLSLYIKCAHKPIAKLIV